jgi:predicted O-linked N-acetylglucosamine transferase (SPINDLY family)
MDYRISNAEMDPPGLTERYHSETLLRLPDSGVSYRPEADCPAVNSLPALAGEGFVFASLNNLTKTNPAVVALWASILQALPHARLMLGNVSDDSTRQGVIEQFGRVGVDAARLLLLPRLSFRDYLALHHQIDLALDPYPYNGGTTTMHSLWMGVPVLTLAGANTVSRVGVSALTSVGLDSFIASSEDAYRQRAIEATRDLPALNAIRRSLRERMAASNRGPAAITRHLEAAYREMWQRYCAS